MDQQQLLNKLIETFEKWNEDLKEARDEYRASAETLEKARKIFVDNTKKRIVFHGLRNLAPYIVAVLFLIVVLMLIFVSVSTGRCATLGWGDYNFNILCEIKK